MVDLAKPKWKAERVHVFGFRKSNAHNSYGRAHRSAAVGARRQQSAELDALPMGASLGACYTHYANGSLKVALAAQFAAPSRKRGGRGK